MTWPTFVSWNWSTPIDDFESGSTYADYLDSYGLEGDLHIVTLQMWLPSGGAPDLRLGVRPGSVFSDETAEWAALPAVRNGAAYIRSWWRWGTAAMVNRDGSGLYFELSGYDQPTEGGNVYLNVLRNAIAPEVVYQDAVDGALNATPAQSANLPLLHHYFGRSAYDSSNSVNAPIIQPFGRSGQVGGATDNNGGISQALDDGSIPGPPYGYYTDQYGVGFFYPRVFDLPENGGAYTGQITWDTQTPLPNPFSGTDYDPLGAQTAVIQGLRVGNPPSTTQNFMAVL